MAVGVSSTEVRLAKPQGSMKERYDVVIVGSGYGGGVSASRLARAGLSVCVLERGKEFVTGEFPARFPDIRRETQVSGGPVRIGKRTGLFDVRMGADMHVLVGCGLGGGSLVNAGVALRPDDRVFDDPVWPGQLRQDGLLDKGYDVARRWLRPQADAQAADTLKYKALAHGSAAVAQGSGTPPQPAEVVISFDEAVSAGGVEQAACTRCGDCCAGCNVGAKNTVALTYLPDAVRHGAECFTELTTLFVSRDEGDRDSGSGDWLVHYVPTETKPGQQEDETRIVRAGRVILAAGSLGSTEVLLRSRDKGLKISSRIGQGFSANGDIIAFGRDAEQRVNAIGVGHPAKVETDTVGAAVSGQICIEDDVDVDRQMYIQEGVMPSAVGPLMPVFFLPGGRLLGAAQALIKGVYQGALQHLHTFFVVSHDSASGKLSLDEKGELRLSWPGADDEPVNGRVEAALTQLVEGNGGQYIKSPLGATSFGAKPATAHPLGGCRMASEIGAGVVDHKGRVFDAGVAAADGSATAVHDGLYVIDGSIMARSLGCNPLLSITAFAERAMMHMAEDNGWIYDVEPVSAPEVVAAE